MRREREGKGGKGGEGREREGKGGNGREWEGKGGKGRGGDTVEGVGVDIFANEMVPLAARRRSKRGKLVSTTVRISVAI